MTGIARILVSFFLALALGSSVAWGAGPFQYRLPQGPGFDPNAVTVVGKPTTHHIVRYENLCKKRDQHSGPLPISPTPLHL